MMPRRTKDLRGLGRAALMAAVVAAGVTAAPAADAHGRPCDRCLRFVTDHVNTPAPARRAFSYVERIWSSHLSSDVPVRIRVTFRSLKAKASTIPNPLQGFSGAIDGTTWYPSSLADALAGLDQDHDAYDMEIFFSDSVEWYYGTDGIVPERLVDFVSVALHEVSHGLGFASRLSMGSGGSFRGLDPDQRFPELSFEVPDLSGQHMVFDRFIETSDGRRPMEIPGRRERSVCLGRAVLEGALYFGGERAAMWNGGKRPLLNVVDPSHVDQKTYQWTRNGLMAPKALRGRALHEPGRIVLGVLEDLGWKVLVMAEQPGEPEAGRKAVASMWTSIH